MLPPLDNYDTKQFAQIAVPWKVANKYRFIALPWPMADCRVHDEVRGKLGNVQIELELFQRIEYQAHPELNLYLKQCANDPVVAVQG